MAAAYVVSITKINEATKYKYSDARSIYRLAGIKIEVIGDEIEFKNQYLHPSDSQSSIKSLYGQITEQYGTSDPEQYVEYLIQHDVLFSAGASEVVYAPEAQKAQVVGDISYIGVAEPGADEADAVWQCRKVDESIVGNLEMRTKWADEANYSQVATDLVALTYT